MGRSLLYAIWKRGRYHDYLFRDRQADRQTEKETQREMGNYIEERESDGELYRREREGCVWGGISITATNCTLDSNAAYQTFQGDSREVVWVLSIAVDFFFLKFKNTPQSIFYFIFCGGGGGGGVFIVKMCVYMNIHLKVVKNMRQRKYTCCIIYIDRAYEACKWIYSHIS